MLDVGRLRLLLAISEQGGVSGAARALGRPTSSVGDELSDTSRSLGLELLDGDTLTPAGRRLAEHGARLLGQLEAAESDAAAVAGRLTGTLRLGVGADAGRVLLADALPALRSAAPELSVHVRQLADSAERVGSLGSTLDVVLAGEYAAAVPHRVDAAVERRELLTEPLLLAVPTRHRATGASVRLAELAQEAWVGGAGDALVALERAAAAAGFAPRLVAEVGEDALALTLVAAGQGVALVPASAAPAPVDGVRFLTVLDGGLRRTVVAAVRRSAIADPGVTRLLEALAAAARRVAAAVPGVSAAVLSFAGPGGAPSIGPSGPSGLSAGPSGPSAGPSGGPSRRPDPLLDPLPETPPRNGRRDPWADKVRPDSNGTLSNGSNGHSIPGRNGTPDPLGPPGFGADPLAGGLPGLPGLAGRNGSGATDRPGPNGLRDVPGPGGSADRPGVNGLGELGPSPFGDRPGSNGLGGPGAGGFGDRPGSTGFGGADPGGRTGTRGPADLPGRAGAPDAPGAAGDDTDGPSSGGATRYVAPDAPGRSRRRAAEPEPGSVPGDESPGGPGDGPQSGGATRYVPPDAPRRSRRRAAEPDPGPLPAPGEPAGAGFGGPADARPRTGHDLSTSATFGPTDLAGPGALPAPGGDAPFRAGPARGAGPLPPAGDRPGRGPGEPAPLPPAEFGSLPPAGDRSGRGAGELGPLPPAEFGSLPPGDRSGRAPGDRPGRAADFGASPGADDRAGRPAEFGSVPGERGAAAFGPGGDRSERGAAGFGTAGDRSQRGAADFGGLPAPRADGPVLPPPGLPAPGLPAPGGDLPSRGSASPYRTPPGTGDASDLPRFGNELGPNPYRADMSAHPTPDPFRAGGPDQGPNPYRSNGGRRGESLGGVELFSATRNGTPEPPAPRSGSPRRYRGGDGAEDTLPPVPAGTRAEPASIFDDLRSEWFVQRDSREDAAPRSPSWQMAADDGWAAAARLAEPTTAGTTTAGLPRRRPQAMAVPGAVGGQTGADTPSPTTTHRSPQEVRGRLSSYRDGVRRGRHAERPDAEDQ